MQEFLRRNFFVVNLALIAVGSYLLAGVVTEFAATAIFQKGAPSSGALVVGPATIAVRPAPPDPLLSLAAGRNPFDAEPIVQPEAEGEGDGGAEPELAEIGVDLLGILVSARPEWSLAMVRAQGEMKMVRVGSLLMDRAEVVEIASRYLVLRLGDNQKVVKLWAEKTAGTARPGMVGPPRPFTPAAGMPGAPGSDFSRGVKKVGPNEFHIERTMLEENLQDLTKLGMQARIIPNYVDGKYQGFRLVGIRPDSLYRAIGLESGDLVTRVNGQDIDTPNKAIQLFEELRNSPTIMLDLERRGQKVTMTYKVK